MKKVILKCKACGLYTLETNCPSCNKETTTPKPAKFSPEDKFGKYRRQYKQNEMDH